MQRYGLSDGQWERIKDLLPGPKIMSVGRLRIRPSGDPVAD
ncbi:hypothetical protein S101468_03095 (plasmid) [Acetobacter pasteurianus subsp. pasteurianus]|uniref:Uncharacterized protein n=2 Tax=Acetobacter pasteurianus TaxID=438 RepID=A0A401WZJ8_ACEPA|nr:hypothetical protein S101468_03095 [Acetobacter pasteurianus subsp. pasteurianus]GCD54610.1 hypothetical protein NBRC3188_3307 [Acetobacter pasteurianus NBRC 3188]